MALDPLDHYRALRHLAGWALVGAAVGTIAGLSSAAFLESLEWATRMRVEHPWLLWMLPLFGLVCGAAYHYVGGRAGEGSALVIDEVHEPRTWLPRRMAPFTFAFSVLSHLFGASVGREGAAIILTGGLADMGARVLRIDARRRRVVLIAAIAGGFGAIFAVPVAGAVFALEVLTVGSLRSDALVPAFAAALVGDRVVIALGVEHEVLPMLAPFDLEPLLLAKVALAAVAFGLAALAFVTLTHLVRDQLAKRMTWPPLRTFSGGVAVIALTYLIDDRAYLGLSSPLLLDAVTGGVGIAAGVFALKLVFTSISIGSGFQGGEVTPLFIIGATMAVPLAHVLDVPVPVLAAVGLVSVFAAASKTPIACTIMAIELFGSAIAVPAAIGCIVAYVVSADHSIYSTQRTAPAP